MGEAQFTLWVTVVHRAGVAFLVMIRSFDC